MSMLTLLPGCTAPGGIQASGRVAWAAIGSSAAPFGASTLLCYGDPNQAQASSASAVHTASKARAALAAVALGRRAGLVLVWHIDLLRLVLLARGCAARVAL